MHLKDGHYGFNMIAFKPANDTEEFFLHLSLQRYYATCHKKSIGTL